MSDIASDILDTDVPQSPAERRARELEALIQEENTKGSTGKLHMAQNTHQLRIWTEEYLSIDPALRRMLICPGKDVLDYYSRAMSPTSKDDDAIRLAQRYRDEFHYRYPQFAPPARKGPRPEVVHRRNGIIDRIEQLRAQASHRRQQAIRLDTEADILAAREGIDA